jgi:anti-sigma regulatory factor (Ser/Thr protein kinase)
MTDSTIHSKEETEPEPRWQVLSKFTLPSQPGMERKAMERVARTVKKLNLSPVTLERVKTAVAETTMNALEHGNHYQAELPVKITVRKSDETLSVVILDNGRGGIRPIAEAPDLEAKLAGMQSPRGWGLFLIEKMVDRMKVEEKDGKHAVELLFNLKGSGNERVSI